MSFKGVTFVTGAGSGIGLSLTLRLLREGYAVSACDINLQSLESIKEDNLLKLNVDVRRKKDIEEAVTQTLAEFGEITGLVACAGIFPARPFLEITEDIWDLTFEVNLKGSLFASQAILPFMKKQQFGSIVFFSSSAARYGSVNGTHYAATKGGLLGLSRVLAIETAEFNIRVNVVSPGITDTPQPRSNMDTKLVQEWVKSIPLQRIGLPEDMVEATLFLLEDESSFITGQDIRINGGALIF